MTEGHPYAGRRVALATRHGKERVLAPALAALGVSLEHAAGVDTDRFGTFTRDVPRVGTQLDAARAKARAALAATGLDLAVASEGSFGADPIGGLIGWNRELVLWVDVARGLEVVGHAQGPGSFESATVTSVGEALAFAARAGFPEHALVVRPDHENHPAVVKGLADEAALTEAVQHALAASEARAAFIETDLRAHLNPTRMAMIARAAGDLVERLRSLCPACGAPGFAPVERVPGLPCAACGLPTREWRGERLACPGCGHGEARARADRKHADPGRCERCNP